MVREESDERACSGRSERIEGSHKKEEAPVWIGEKTAKEALPPIVEQVQTLLDEGRKMFEDF